MIRFIELLDRNLNADWKIDFFKKLFTVKVINTDYFKQLEQYKHDKVKGKLKKLYKYCTFDSKGYNISNLKNNELYLSNPNIFNDPFDSYFNLYIDENDKGDFLTYFRNDLRIACLSEVPNSLLMWSHYADKHTGFCIEYDFSHIDEIINNIMPVMYSSTLPDLSNIKPNIYFLQLFTILKAEVWNYELEWRFILELTSNIKDKLKYIYKSNKGDYFLKVPKPKKIVLGAKISEENKKIITKISSKMEIEVVRATLSDNKFELYI